MNTMTIIAFGDSLSSCGGPGGRFSDILAARFPAHTFINRGIGGDTLSDGLRRLRHDVLDLQPDIVLVNLGANDWWRNERPVKVWGADLEKIIRLIIKAGAQPVILGVFGPWLDEEGQRRPKETACDERALEFAAIEAELAKRYQIPYLPNMQEYIIGRRNCWADRNHPNSYGNRFVANSIQALLAPLLDTKPLPLFRAPLQSLRDIWEEAVHIAPNQLAAIDGNRRLTYAEAATAIAPLAAAIHHLCRQQSSRVAILLPNSLEYYLIYWAVMLLGGIVVPLNPTLKEANYLGILQRIQPDLLIMRGKGEHEINQALKKLVTPPVIVELQPSQKSGRIVWSALLTHSTPLPERMPIATTDPAIIMHTSGTTATPKGAVMRHCDLLFNIMVAINAHSFDGNDVHLLVNPMFHCTALYSTLPAAAYSRTPVVITDSTSGSELLELVRQHNVTTFLSVPTIFQRLLEATSKPVKSTTLRLMAYAGSPMKVQTIHLLRHRFPNVALHNFFGLTETIAMTHVLRNDESESRPDSIGRLLPFIEAVIIDPESMQILPSGKVGELLFARNVVISTYFGQPELLNDAIVTIDGREWFRTGDLAMVDDEGFFFLKGRRKEMIIVGGENVYAAEVEAVLQNHPAVREAAVVGEQACGIRSSLGEIVVAYVVPSTATPLSERELRAHCSEKLAGFKVPVKIYFLSQLPRNPAGKILRDQLTPPAES